jgi:hypothetical protein
MGNPVSRLLKFFLPLAEAARPFILETLIMKVVLELNDDREQA